MQLPDEAITYDYQSLLVPPTEEWTPAAEMRTRNFLPPGRLTQLADQVVNVHGWSLPGRAAGVQLWYVVRGEW